MIVDIGGMHTGLSEPVFDSWIIDMFIQKVILKWTFSWLAALNCRLSTSGSENF